MQDIKAIKLTEHKRLKRRSKRPEESILGSIRHIYTPDLELQTSRSLVPQLIPKSGLLAKDHTHLRSGKETPRDSRYGAVGTNTRRSSLVVGGLFSDTDLPLMVVSTSLEIPMTEA
jgi:hypothetical protein